MGCCGSGSRGSHEARETNAGTTVDSNDDPMVILKLRLAKGEISPEEYDRLAAILSQ